MSEEGNGFKDFFIREIIRVVALRETDRPSLTRKKDRV
jgi:hypothetical protein